MDINNLVLSFLLYSFLGWCIEVTYQYFKHKIFINRGFLKGPFCPIYGISILILIHIFSGSNISIFSLFIVASVGTSAIEYATSYLLEKCFKLKWWDYSEDAFNIKGRICFHFSLAWGLASVFVIYLLNPFISRGLTILTSNISEGLTFLVILYFSLDFFFTTYKLLLSKDFFKNKMLKKNSYKF